MLTWSVSRCRYFVGEDEGQEQAGSTSAGHHQGERDESGREDQGGDPGVEPDQHQALGRLAQELHPGECTLREGRSKVNHREHC